MYKPGAEGDPNPASLPGYAFVKQERVIDLQKGRSTIRFTDVASQIDPTTVSFVSLTDPAARVLEQNYQFDLVNAAKLMERYLDKKITLEQASGNNIQTFGGTLVGTSGGVILKHDKGDVQIVSHYTNASFPELPGGLITKPHAGLGSRHRQGRPSTNPRHLSDRSHDLVDRLQRDLRRG